MSAKRPPPEPPKPEPGIAGTEWAWVDRGEEGWFHVNEALGIEDGPHLLPAEPDEQPAEPEPGPEPQPDLDPVAVRGAALEAAYDEYNRAAEGAWADYQAEHTAAWERYEARLHGFAADYQTRAERIRKG